MTNPEKFIVSVTREVPYSDLTNEEKMYFATVSNNVELLELLANDSSVRVLETLVLRAARIPENILCNALLKNRNEKIRKLAKARICNELIYTNGEISSKYVELLFSFLYEFFDDNFVNSLNEVENKREALSAIYLYEIKYGFLESEVFLFNKNGRFNVKGSNGYFSLYEDGQPHNATVWEMLEGISYFKYMPEEQEEILKNNLISTKNVDAFKAWIEESNPHNLDKPWISILSKTLFNLGSPDISIERKKEERFKLCMIEGLEVIEKAEAAIGAMYETSRVSTVYGKKTSSISFSYE